MRRVINEFLNDGITKLTLLIQCSIKSGFSQPKLCGDEILAIADKCPKLERLQLSGCKLESWPIFRVPWTSLRDLNFYLSTTSPRDLFRDVKLHQGLPNLEMVGIVIYDKFSCLTLPDMEDCKKLTRVYIKGKFSVTSLPLQLRLLTGNGTIINMSKATFQAKHLQCHYIDDRILFET